MAKKHGFRIDLHVHSVFSGESLADPRDILEAAIEKGLDGICVTEHQSLYASRPFDELKKDYPSLVVLRGVELSTDAGHMLVYGIDDAEWNDWGKDRSVNGQELIDRVRKLGGVAIPAHPWQVVPSPGNQEGLQFTVDERITILDNLTAIEACNGKQLGHPVICEILGAFAKQRGIGRIGGSDAHVPENVGNAYTVFRTPVCSPRELVRAILSKTYYPQTS
ncbi:MAG: CehA/McbA family metallohydrolase [Bacillota bacterium]|nr:PHP domain-containing protein [Candidatus Fermentithermobacillaceae bacterium]